MTVLLVFNCPVACVVLTVAPLLLQIIICCFSSGVRRFLTLCSSDMVLRTPVDLLVGMHVCPLIRVLIVMNMVLKLFLVPVVTMLAIGELRRSLILVLRTCRTLVLRTLWGSWQDGTLNCTTLFDPGLVLRTMMRRLVWCRRQVVDSLDGLVLMMSICPLSLMVLIGSR